MTLTAQRANEALEHIELCAFEAALADLCGDGPDIGMLDLFERVGGVLMEGHGDPSLEWLGEQVMDEGLKKMVFGVMRAVGGAVKKHGPGAARAVGRGISRAAKAASPHLKKAAKKAGGAAGRAAVAGAKAVGRAATSDTANMSVTDAAKKAKSAVTSKEFWTKKRSTGIGKKVKDWSSKKEDEEVEVPVIPAPRMGHPDYLEDIEGYYFAAALLEMAGLDCVIGLHEFEHQLTLLQEGDDFFELDMGLLFLEKLEEWELSVADTLLEREGAIKDWKKKAAKERGGKAAAIGRGISKAASWAKNELTKTRQFIPGKIGAAIAGKKAPETKAPEKNEGPKKSEAPPKAEKGEAKPESKKKEKPETDSKEGGSADAASSAGSSAGGSSGDHAIKTDIRSGGASSSASGGGPKVKVTPKAKKDDEPADKDDESGDKPDIKVHKGGKPASPIDKAGDKAKNACAKGEKMVFGRCLGAQTGPKAKAGATDKQKAFQAKQQAAKTQKKFAALQKKGKLCGNRPCKPGEKPRGPGGEEELAASYTGHRGEPMTETYTDRMIRWSQGGATGQRMHEDSSEGSTSGFNRHAKLMSPATRERVLRSWQTEIEAFAEDRGLRADLVAGIAEAAMRLGRVPELRQYGVSGDDAAAITHFVAGEVLNLAIEDVSEASTGGMGATVDPMRIGSAFMQRGVMVNAGYYEKRGQDGAALKSEPRVGVDMEDKQAYTIDDLMRMGEDDDFDNDGDVDDTDKKFIKNINSPAFKARIGDPKDKVKGVKESAAGLESGKKGATSLTKKLKKNGPAYTDDDEFDHASGGSHQPVTRVEDKTRAQRKKEKNEAVDWRQALGHERLLREGKKGKLSDAIKAANKKNAPPGGWSAKDRVSSK